MPNLKKEKAEEQNRQSNACKRCDWEEIFLERCVNREREDYSNHPALLW